MPSSLYGKLILVMLSGLILAQLLSAFILLRDRGQVLYESIRENLLVRTSGIVRLLNSLPSTDRQQLLPLLTSPDLRITLSDQPISTMKPDQDANPASIMVRHQLQERLPQGTEVRVSIEGSMTEPKMSSMHNRHMMGGGQMSGPWAYIHGLHAKAQFYHIQTKLQDGSWVSFERGFSERLFDWPTRLLIVLGISMSSVLLLSIIGVRSVVRPLQKLRQAAEGLGKDIKQPPLDETGPTEVKDTAKAFNTMQIRLKNYIEDRASILAAISHDLKTPLTRIRLRTDLMDDEELRTKTQKDLDDMESMVSATLDFMRGTETREPSRRIDLNSLLESIQEDYQEAGKTVQLREKLIEPYQGKPLALKRCLVNLVENAIRYGGQVDIEVQDFKDKVVILIRDNGPGIPEDALQKVFDPFFRLETSRAQHTGGTGLGLGIARNIARAHGGDLMLQNSSEGGLCAKLTLPR